jgi:predicted ATP-grasp superfamily ATP-dependent carboligase
MMVPGTAHKEKLNVLMVSGWVDQAFTFIRSFSRREQINLFVADCWPNSACGHSRYCKKLHLVPSFEEPGYIPALLEVCRQERIDIVLPVHQEDLVEIAKHKNLFEAEGFRLPIPDYALIELAIDKYRMAILAKENEIATPETYLLSEIRPGDLGTRIVLPVLVKLRNSTGQRGQKKIGDVATFETHIGSLLETYEQDDIIIQEYIPGTVRDTMYTVGLLYDHGHRLKACIPLKKIRSRPYTGGTAICTVAENRPDAREMAIKLMSAFGTWKGIANVEIKIDPEGKPRFIEVNPRPWGSIYGSYVAGVDLPALWLKVALHEDFSTVCEFQEGVYGSFLSRDLVLLRDLVRNLFNSERRYVWQVLRTYSRPYLGKGRNARYTATSDFVLDDLKPFFKNLARF